MRRGLPHLLALVLGVGAALGLASCGGSSTRGGIPEASGSNIKDQLEEIRSRVSDGDCEGISTQLRALKTRIDNLPRSVDNRLVSALRDGADRLQENAIQDCNDNSAPTETQTTPPATNTAPPQTQTQTVPPETTTTPPETTTTPPETAPPPTATIAPVPPPEPAPVPPPPVVSPGGGTPPDVP
jgi:hypothetical protein